MENRLPTSKPATPDEIRRQMNTIRSSLGGDVQGIVSNAQELTDWRHYVRTFPWGSLGVASLLGYFAVPQKTQVIRPDKETLAELAKENRLVVHSASDLRPKTGVVASLLASDGEHAAAGRDRVSRSAVGKDLRRAGGRRVVSTRDAFMIARIDMTSSDYTTPPPAVPRFRIPDRDQPPVENRPQNDFVTAMGDWIGRHPAVCIGVAVTLGAALGCLIKRR